LGVVTAAGGLQIYTYSEEEDEGGALRLQSETPVTSGLALALGTGTLCFSL
jgi:hypothetical protein